ncbi:NAD(P)-binding domain-containing protein [Paeniglutamicibacter antarcticus]|uniref:NAD(P)-binding domain-containing protein n=1 Tax=Arthrobacter terrae TaxID=2935737 RepID=A0A931CU07_9MICC|nr:NAD(P)/FAD-dependent oxidoreductase [Arthrobacter terrae]MBG0741394.1 NAD(P)-binding domain-containing protein [Arthrobacter terrae]
MNSHILDALVIGAGQSGLAAGYHLQRAGLDFSILDSGARVGDVWRQRWDSLRLFTPARYSALPGLNFPAPAASFPAKDAFADYLETYAQHFQLPVRTGIRVHSVRRAGEVFAVDTSAGQLLARTVVATPGANSTPQIPGMAQALDPGIMQLHSSEYRSPAGLPAGAVVVVGAGTSGAEIALELAQSRPKGTVYLSGKPTAHIPDAVFRFAGPLYWRLVNSVLTLDTKTGRKVAAGFLEHGAPLIRVSVREVERAGAVRLPRLSGAVDGKPVFDVGTADGGTHAAETKGPASVCTIIWATGYRPVFQWIEGLAVDSHGWPATIRGVVPKIAGLYFVGLPFQYALTSGLVGGVGRDAEYIVEQLKARTVSLASTGALDS